jgi:hypothetical protein
LFSIAANEARSSGEVTESVTDAAKATNELYMREDEEPIGGTAIVPVAVKLLIVPLFMCVATRLHG